DDIDHAQITPGDATFHLGAGQPDSVGVLQCPQVLLASVNRGDFAHTCSLPHFVQIPGCASEK
ncbi:MAG TPA: hypothetical protein VEX39_14280, partial [Thermoleophilaceae bacterium]|nr:hypothetical protein [Thermoleophilaceae bacterium]